METQLSRTPAQAEREQSPLPRTKVLLLRRGKGEQPSSASSLPSPQALRERRHWAVSCHGNLEGPIQVRWPSPVPKPKRGGEGVATRVPGTLSACHSPQFPGLSPFPLACHLLHVPENITAMPVKNPIQRIS